MILVHACRSLANNPGATSCPVMSDVEFKAVHPSLGVSFCVMTCVGIGDLESLTPDVLGLNSSCQQLHVADRGLQYLTSIHTAGWQQLHTLTIDAHRLTGLAGGALAGVNGLIKLRLDGKLQSLTGDGIFSGLANLLELDMNHQPMRWLSPSVLTPMTALQTLYVRLHTIASSDTYTVSSLEKPSERSMPQDVRPDLINNVSSCWVAGRLPVTPWTE